MYMCVTGIEFASVSKIFLLDFETLPTVCCFLFFILLEKGVMTVSAGELSLNK
jgi:hypothetical protein